MSRAKAGRTRAEPAPVLAYTPRPFTAPWWLRSPHAQTVGGKLLRPALPSRLRRLRRLRIDTPDGDFLDLDIADEPAGAPVVLVLHGLEGSTRRRYMLLTYRALLQQGLRPVGLNFRGCSGEPNRAARFYHSGETGDLAHVLARLPELTGAEPPYGLVGYSLGGNVLLAYLGEQGEAARSAVGAAAAVSVPFDLSAGADCIERGAMGRLYTHYFMRQLRRKTAAKAPLLQELCDLPAALRARTLRAFDEAVTAPIHGFHDAADYYRRASSAAVLDRVAVPTLLIHADDDPFLPVEHIPLEVIRSNPALTLALTRGGGHVGFIGGRHPAAAEFYAESELSRFLGGRLLPRPRIETRRTVPVAGGDGAGA